MVDATDPKSVAQNMFAIRGLEASIEQCDKYITGKIKSEKGDVFWTAVKVELLAMKD